VPRYEPFPSLDAMLEPAEITRLTGLPVRSLTVEDASGVDTSTGARFQRVYVDGAPRSSFFIKCVEPAKDWVALSTDDQQRRALAVWSEGVLDRLPRQVDGAVVACASWDDGYAVLMPDISDHLLVPGKRLGMNESGALVSALAALHVRFWEDVTLAELALGLCPPKLFLSHTSPQRASRLRQLLESFVFGAIENGWDALPTFIDAGLVSDLRALNDDPSPILAALADSPRTLVHSDYRPANLGLRTSGDGSITVILVDWGRPLFGAPTIDLGYYLGWTALERATDVDTTVAAYESHLRVGLGHEIDDLEWEVHREVGILGGLLNTICFSALRARGDDSDAATERAALEWWAPRMRAALDLI